MDLDAALPYIDRCLGCMACVTACPSGVAYGHLLTPFRAAGRRRSARRPLMSQVTRQLVKETLPYPNASALAATAGRLGKLVRAALPGELRGMLELLPADLPPAQPLPEIYPAVGTAARARGAAGRLCAAGAGAADQLGDAARAGAERRRDGHPARAGLLRLALAAHRRRRAGA